MPHLGKSHRLERRDSRGLGACLPGRDGTEKVSESLCLTPHADIAVNLFLPLVMSGRDPVHEHMLRDVACVMDWTEQRRRWGSLPRR
jgi:hypothetical protein